MRVSVHQFKSKNPLENWRWNFKTVEDFEEVENPNTINYICQFGEPMSERVLFCFTAKFVLSH